MAERSRVAMVATTDVHYGLSRMYQAFRSDSPLDLRVFRDMREARTWLGLAPE
jgi:tetrahydromethanopterin S-methyltransferase subunit E